MSTRALVALVLFVVAGLPLVGNAWLQYQRDRQRAETDRDALLAVVAADISDEIGDVLGAVLETARGDGSLPGLADALREADRDATARLWLNRYLNALGSRDPVNIRSVGLLDRQGRNLADLEEGRRGGDESLQPYFRAVLDSGLPQLHGPLQQDNAGGSGIIVAAPIRDPPAAPHGVLRIRFEAARIGQILAGNLRLRPSLAGFILDRSGQPFARAGLALASLPPADLGNAGAADWVDGDGQRLGRVLRRALPHSGWQLLLVKPAAADAVADAERERAWRFYLVGLPLLLLAAAWLLGHLLARPLVRLTATVESIAAGDLERRIRPRGSVELRHLAEAVNAMNGRLGDSLGALRRLADDLDQRVQQRTAELESSHRHLSQAMEQLVQNEKLAALGGLVAGIAHELNTPIGNAVTAASALHEHIREFERDFAGGQLRRSAVERLVADGREAAGMVERNLQKAHELIGHFKQVAVDQSSSRRRRFQLAATVEEVLATLQPRLKRLPYAVQREVDPAIWLDSYPGPLEQVLTNLVSNSLEHGLAGRDHGSIRIHAEAAEGRVRLHYEDDGVGIPLALQRRVFEPFFTTRLGSGGSGLGLYLVHSLVSGHLGGSLGLQSAPGEGVHFTLDLPLQAPDASPP